MKKYFIRRSGGGLGDKLLCAFFAVILRDNGIDAHTFNYFPYDMVCKSCLMDKTKNWIYYRYTHNYKSDINTVSQNINKFRNKFGILITNNRTSIPVEYPDMTEIKGVDIVINSSCGPFTKIREWPFFDILKEKYYKKNIKFVDASDILKKYGKGDQGSYACLNYVNKSKICIAIETGFSHLISDVGANKTIILQSGFVPYQFWSIYNYEVISFPVSCGPCYIATRHGQKCKYGHCCMGNISVETVYRRSMEKLNEHIEMELIKRQGPQETDYRK